MDYQELNILILLLVLVVNAIYYIARLWIEYKKYRRENKAIELLKDIHKLIKVEKDELLKMDKKELGEFLDKLEELTDNILGG